MENEFVTVVCPVCDAELIVHVTDNSWGCCRCGCDLDEAERKEHGNNY